jgi:hypothetical protein
MRLLRRHREELGVKSREIVYLSIEELRFFFVAVLEGLDGADVSQGTL